MKKIIIIIITIITIIITIVCYNNFEESGTKVHRIRKTQNGSVLIELDAIEDRQKLEEAIKLVTGPESNVRDLIPILKLEIRDLDGVTKEQEIQAAVAKAVGFENGDLFQLTIFKTKGTTSHMAVVDLLEADALRLAKKGKIQIGRASSRVRLRADYCAGLMTPPCFAEGPGKGESQFNGGLPK